MSKHLGDLKQLHTKLLAPYGVDDAVVIQFKTEINLQANQKDMLCRGSSFTRGNRQRCIQYPNNYTTQQTLLAPFLTSHF